MDINLIIAQNLKRLREERNLSLAQLSSLTGVSKMTLCQIERGETNPTVNTVWKIAGGLNVPYPALFEQKGSDINVIRKKDLKSQESEDEHYRIFWYFLRSDLKNIDISVMEIDIGHKLSSLGQSEKAFEYVLVIQGEVILSVEDEQYHLCKGDAICFEASLKHSYQCCGAVAFKAVIMEYYLI